MARTHLWPEQVVETNGTATVSVTIESLHGTFQLLQCLKNNLGAIGGRGYVRIKVYKSKTNYLYIGIIFDF